MGSLTQLGQVDLDSALSRRNEEYGVHHADKAKLRHDSKVKGPGVHENADSWWKEGENESETS